MGVSSVAVDDGEVAHLADHAEIAEPEFVLIAQRAAGPFESGLGEGIEADDFGVGAGLFIVVSFYHRAAHLLEFGHTLVGIRIVSHHITNAHMVRHALGSSVGHDSVERFEVGVDVSKYSKFH